jgi:flagellar basal-body rod protein FlgB
MEDASGISFGPTIQLLSEAGRGARLEHDQIANNIANVNTPNFRRSTTSFREALAASLGTPASTDELAMTTNDARQFNVNGAVPPVPFDPQAHVDDSTQMRADKSNVDIDQEMALLEQNTGYQSTMSTLLSKEYAWIREAVTESAT